MTLDPARKLLGDEDKYYVPGTPKWYCDKSKVLLIYNRAGLGFSGTINGTHYEGLPLASDTKHADGTTASTVGGVRRALAKAVAAIGVGGNAAAADTTHEGDWEMFMNVLELDPESRTVWLRSCTASQHYVGQTLPTQMRFQEQLPTPTLGEDVVEMNGTHPRIYVAGGSHATFFLSSRFLQATKPVLWANCYIHPVWGAKHWGGILVDTTDNLKDINNDGSPDALVAPEGPDVAASYEIVPLDYDTAQWRGHWGDHDIHPFKQWLWKYDSGSESPGWRTSWGETTETGPTMFARPLIWHNQFVRLDQIFVAISP